MKKTRDYDIKREQKKSLYYREFSKIFQDLCRNQINPEFKEKLQSIYVTRIDLSADRSVVYVYFSTFDDPKNFKHALEILKLYKLSVRKALGKQVQSRYVPDIMFLYDKVKDKQRRVTDILDKISQTTSSHD